MKTIFNIKEQLHSGKLNFFFFLVVVFTLPINRQLFTIAIWPWIFTWIVEGKYNEKFNKQQFRNNLYAIILLPGLFFLMLLSVLWSGDRSQGIEQIGIQASLVIFPFFLSFSNKIYRDLHSFRKIVLSFSAGIMVVTLFLLIKALIYAVSIRQGQPVFNPVINGWENVFYFSQFSYLIHPTYLGLMVLFALLFWITDLKNQILIDDHKIIKLLVIIYFFIIIFLLSARSVILASIFLGLFLYLSLISSKVLKSFGLLLTLVGLVLFLSFSPRAARLFTMIKNSDNESFENIDVRFKIWKSASVLLKNKPLIGVGTGSVKNELEHIYTKNNYEFPVVYNCHNQFLEQWLSAGLISLLLLLLTLMIPLFSSKLILPVIYYSGFLIIISIVFMFESVFCRFYGVAFFSIFYSLLTSKRFNISGSYNE